MWVGLYNQKKMAHNGLNGNDAVVVNANDAAIGAAIEARSLLAFNVQGERKKNCVNPECV